MISQVPQLSTRSGGWGTWLVYDACLPHLDDAVVFFGFKQTNFSPTCFNFYPSFPSSRLLHQNTHKAACSPKLAHITSVSAPYFPLTSKMANMSWQSLSNISQFFLWGFLDYLIENATALFGSDRSTLRNHAPSFRPVSLVRYQDVLVIFYSFYLSPLTCGESFLLLSKFLEKKLGNLHNLHFAD